MNTNLPKPQLSLIAASTKGFFAFLLAFLMLQTTLFAQVAGDFRSANTGNWSASTSWERYTGTIWEASGVGANNPGQTPTATSSVWIQIGHVISLTADASCLDLHLNNTALNRLNLNVSKLAVFGKLRAYSAAVGTIPGADGVPPANTNWITSTSGKISVEGNTRNLTVAAQWSGANGAATFASGNSFDIEINLNAGQTATCNTDIRMRNITVNTGSLTMAGANNIYVDQGAANVGAFSIASTGTVNLGTGTIQRTVTQSTTNHFATFTSNGTLNFTAATTANVLAAGTVTFNGTVGYTAAGAQTFVTRGATNTAAALANTYNDVVISGSGIKTIGLSTSINGNLTISAGTLADAATFLLTGPGAGTGKVLDMSAATATAITLVNTSADPFPLFQTYNMHSTLSTVNYNSGVSQNIRGGLSYGNLAIGGANAKVADGNLTVKGTLTITNGALTDANKTITVNGAIVNNAGYTGSGKILLSGGSAVHALTGAGAYTNLELSDVNGASANASFAISGALTLTSGTFAIGAGFTTTLNGTMPTGGSGLLGGSLTSDLAIGGTGSLLNTLNFDQTGTFPNLRTVTITRATSGVVSLGSNLTIQGTLTLNAAGLNFNIGANLLTFNGQVTPLTITAGTFNGGASSDLSFTGANSVTAFPLVTGGVRDLTINRPALSVTLATTAPLTILRNLTITAGTFADGTALITGPGAGAGVFSMNTANTAAFTMTNISANPFPVFQTYDFHPTASTVNYNGANTTNVQNISALPQYGNLTTANGVVGFQKLFTGTTLVKGTLTTTSGFVSYETFTVTVNGNLSNAGTHNAAASGKILLSGGTAQHQMGGTGGYGNIELNDNQGVLTTANVVVNGNLALTTGTFTNGNFTFTQPFGKTTTVNSTFTKNAGAGLVTVGELVINSSGTFSMPTNAPVTINGNLTNTGALAAGTGTYTFSNSGTITSSSALAFTAVVNNGVYINNATINVSGAFTINTGAFTFTNNSNLAIAGTVTVNASGGTLTNNGALNFSGAAAVGGGGTISNNNGGTFQLASASVGPALNAGTATNLVKYYGSTSAQTVRAATYYNLEIDKALQTANGSAGITVNNDFTVTNGTFADAGNSVTGNGTGTFTVSAGAIYTTTRIATPWLPTLYTALKIVLDPTSTINYNGGTTHNIVNNPNGTAILTSYGHLGFAGAVIKTVSGTNISCNNLTISAGTLADGGNIITVKGTLTNDALHSGTGKILMQGTDPQIITTTAAATRTFGNIEIDNASGVTLGGALATFIYNINTGNTLTLTNGNLNVGNATLLLTGNILAGTPALLATTSTSNLSYAGTAAGHILPSSVTSLQHLTLNNANGVGLSSSITMSAAGVLTLTNGRLNLGAFDLTLLNPAVAAIVGGSSTTIMVQADGAGQLKRNVATGSYVFPVGDNSGGVSVSNNNGLDYSPVTLNFTANSANRIIGVRVTDDRHPSDPSTTDYISRYWSFTEGLGTGTYTYTGTFTYSATLPSDLVGTYANVKPNSWDTDNFFWTQFTNTGAAGNIAVTAATETSGPLADVQFTGRVNSAITYTWQPTSGTNSWTTPTNWSPNRFSAQPTDILQFTNGGNPLVSNIPSQTIARLIVGDGGFGNTDVTFTSSAGSAQTLTISNTTGTNFDIQAGSTLRLSSTLANATLIAFTGTNTATINGALVLDPNTSGNNTYTSTNSATSVNGAITNNGGTVTSAAANLTFGAGSFYNHARNGGAIPLATWNTTSTCNITGITSTNLTTFTAPVATPFGNLIWNCPSQTIITGGLTTASYINGSFQVLAGTFYDNGFLLSGPGTGTGKAFAIANGAVFNMTNGTTTTGTLQAGSFPLFASYSFGTTSTVNYNGNAVQPIVGNITYGNLRNTNNTKTLTAPATVANDFTIASGVVNDGGFVLTVQGNIINDGTHATAGSGKILMQGSGAKTISTTAAATRTFGNLEIDNASGVTLGGALATFIYNINTGNTLTLTNGNLNVGSATLLLTGNTLAGTPALLATTSTSNLSYAGTAAGHILPSSVTSLQHLTLNNANGVGLSSSITMSAAGVLTLTNGRLNLGAFDLTLLNPAVAAIVGGSSTTIMVQADGAGQLKRNVATGSYVFPVGDNSGGVSVSNNNGLDYSPVTLNFTANSANRIIGVRVTDDRHPSDPSTTDYISRYWSFTEGLGTGTYTYTGTFTYSATLPSDLVGTYANVKPNSWDTDNFFWTQFTNTGAAGNIAVTAATETSGPLADVQFTGRVNSAITYTWQPTSGTNSWTTPTNWSPNRFSAQPTDILQFTNGGNPLVSNIPSQTIARLIVGDGGFGNTDVTFTSSAGSAQTLTISNTTGTNFDIQAGSTLRLSSTLANATLIAFTGTNTATINGALVLDPNTSGNNTYTSTNSATSVNGAITNNGGTVTSAAANLTFGAGSFYNHARNGGAIPLATWNTTSTCNITGITSTNLTTFTAPVATPFGNLIWNCPSQTIITGGLTTASYINGSFQVLAGTFYDNGFLLSGPGTGTGKAFAIANGAVFNMTNGTTTTGTLQAGSFPLFASYSFGTTSTVNYNGNAVQPIVGNITYGTLRSINTKTFTGTTNVASDLIITSGTVSDNGFVITVLGSLQTDGSHTSTGSGKIVMQGSFAQNINFISGTGTRTFGNLEINSSNSVYLIGSSANLYQVNGTLTLTAGYLDILNAALSLPGNVVSTSGLLAGSSAALLTVLGTTGGNLGSLGFKVGAQELNNLTINRTGSNSAMTLTTPLSVSTLTLTNGIINNGSNPLRVLGSSVASITGGSATSYVGGALERSLPVIGISITYPFPVGKSTANLFELINPTTTAPSIFHVEVFDGPPPGGILGLGLSALGNRYWETAVPTGNINSIGNVQLTRTTTVANPDNVVAQSAAVDGNYEIRGRNIITSTSIRSSTTITPSEKYYIIADVQCPVAGTIGVDQLEYFAGQTAVINSTSTDYNRTEYQWNSTSGSWTLLANSTNFGWSTTGGQGQILYVRSIYRIAGGSDCETISNVAAIKINYPNVGWSYGSGTDYPAIGSCGNYGPTWCAGSGTHTVLNLSRGVNYTVSKGTNSICNLSTSETVVGYSGTSETGAYSGGTPINITFPALPSGTVINSTTATITYTSSSYVNSNRNELRVEVNPPAGSTVSDIQPSSLASPGTVTNASLGSFGTANPAGSWQFRFKESVDNLDEYGNPARDAFITRIILTVNYTTVAMPNVYMQGWASTGSTECGWTAIDYPAINTYTFDAVTDGDHLLNVSSNLFVDNNGCGTGSGWIFGEGSAVLKYKQNTTIVNTTSAAAVSSGTSVPLTYTLGGAHNNPAVNWSVVASTGSAGGTFSGNNFITSGAGTVTLRAQVGVCFSDVTITINSIVNNPGAIQLSARTVCPGTTVTADNVIAASTGTPPCAGPDYYWYYNLNGAGYVLWAGPTSLSSMALPPVVTNTPGNHLIARNSAFACTGQANNGTTLDIPLTVLPTTASTPIATGGTNSTCSTLDINWTGIGAINFNYDVSTDEFFSLINIVNNANASSSPVTVAGLSPGLTYYYRVRANGCTAQTPYSNTGSGTTLPPTPDVPNTISSAASSIGCSAFTANWPSSSRSTSYFLQIDNNSDFSSPVFSSNVGNVLSYTQSSGLAAGNRYYYRVAGVNVCGTSAYSGSVTLDMLPAIPPQVSATIGTAGCNSFIANWLPAGAAPANNATNYYIDVSTSASFGVLDILNNFLVPGGAVTSYTVSGLGANATYYYRVRGWNTCGGFGPVSGGITAVTLPPQPATPTLPPLGNQGTGIGCTFFTANWNSSAGTSIYYIDISTSSTFATTIRTNTVDASAYPNGAGGTFTFPPGSSADIIAREACESVYGDGNCSVGDCGNFTYYYQTGAPSCACAKPAGSYEFIYYNAGYTTVGQDYGGQTTNITTAVPFTRQKTSAACDANSWTLTQANLGTAGASATSFDETGLDAGVTYYYRVRAGNNCGTSSSSAISGPVTLLPAAPDIPASLAPGTPTCNTITANWGTAARASVYFLDISSSPTFSTLDIQNSLPVGGTTFTQTGLTAGVNYYYRVRGNNSCGTSAFNGAVTAPTLPATPVVPIADNVAGGCTAFTATWSASANTISYFLDIASDAAFSSLILSNQSVSGTSYNQSTGVFAGNTYYYRVRASNVCGTSLSSAIAMATMLPATPAANAANAPSALACNSFRANWGSSPNATNYFVDVATDAGFTGLIAGWSAHSAGNVLFADVTGLNAGTTYFYRVRASNSCGTAANSGTRSATTLPPAPGTPTAQPASAVGCNSFTANWTSNAPLTATAHFMDVSTTATFATFVAGWNNHALGAGTSTPVAGLTTGATYYYRVRANNSCGTSASSNTQTVTLDKVPVITSCPGDITLNTDASICDATVFYNQAIAIGPEAPTIEYSQASGTGFPLGNTTVYITATNDCGTDNCEFVVTVNDAEPPTIICPDAQFVELDGACYAELPDYTGLASAFDNCSTPPAPGLPPNEQEPNTIVITQDPAAGLPLSVGLITVSLTATDATGNFNTCSFDVFIQDNILPTPVVQDIEVFLDPTGNVSIDPSGSDVNLGTYDNCGVLYTSIYPNSFSCSEVGVQEVTYEVGDINGNVNTTPVFITVTDLVAPEALCRDVTVQLDETGNYNDDGFGLGAQADNGSTDACGISSVFAAPSVFTCAELGSNALTFEATDVNGNFSQCYTTVTVEDNIAPIISCPGGVTVDCDASTDPSNTGEATATDNVDACASASITYSDISGQNPSNLDAGYYNYTITRTWVATDGSGNATPCDQVITVQDVTDPTITCPADVTISCESDNTSASNGEASGTDICSAAIYITEGDVSTQDGDNLNGGYYNYTITRTWRSTDVSGNYTECDQIVTVQDVTDPTITCPADVTIDCEDNILSAFNGHALSTDNCSAAVFITESDVNGQNPDFFAAGHYNYTITRTWTSTDVSGNFTTCDQTITVQDVTSPSVSCPANTTVNCQDDNTSASNGVATGGDNCSSVVITESDASTQNASLASAGHYNYTITRTWRSTDVTGNYSECDQTITVQDITNPSISCPANTTVNCQDDNTSASNGVATGGDNCSSAAITESDASTQDPISLNAGYYNYAITRTWRSTDVSGNYTECDQVVTVHDITDPAITCPADVTIDCEDNTLSAANGIAAGTDNCSATVYISESDVNGQDGNDANPGHYNYTIIRTWRSTDVTGNYTECDQTITVQDITDPTVTCPADVTVSCEDDNTSASNGTASGTDICSAAIHITESDVNGQDGNDANTGHYNYTIIRTWRSTDVSGNYTECDQIVTVHDITNPTVTCPVSVTVNCEDDNTSASNGAATGTDICSAHIYITESDVSAQIPDNLNPGHYNYTITRTWRSTDVSGNYADCIQTITVQDITDPTVTCPANTTVNCQDDNTSASNGVATGGDNCSSVAITQSDVNGQDANDANTGHYNYTITRTWRSTDVTGNFSECNQIVTVQDVTAPTVTCPADVTVNCEDDHISTATGVATGTDICSAHIYITESDVSGQDPNPSSPGHYNYLITRTWRSTDVTGNYTECDQIVTVHNTTPPVALTQPFATSLDASGTVRVYPTDIDAGSHSICGGPVTLQISHSPAGPYVDFFCSDVGPNTVYLYVTDESGNLSIESAVVTISDVTPPVAICQNITVQLDASGNASITAAQVDNGSHDACPIASRSVAPNTFTCSNVGPNLVTLSVTDVNSNLSICNATVTVQDHVAPIAICKNIGIQLNALGEATITASQVNNGSNDACGIASLGVAPFKFGCENVGNNTVTLTVTDNNTNVTTCTANVLVEDKTPAIPICQNVTVQLNAAGQAFVTAAMINNGSNDACGVADLSANITTFNCSAVGNNTVTLTVTDNNGNTSQCTSVVTVQDNIFPTALCKNATVTLASVGPAAGSASITPASVNNGSFDNCGIATTSVNPNTFGCSNIGANAVTLTVTDVNGHVSTCNATVQVVGLIPSCSIASQPTGTLIGAAYTGGVPTNIYLGYGYQSTRLQTTILNGTGQFYSWTCSNPLGLARLSCTSGATCSAPVFTPLVQGNYTFTVTITNNYGCVTTCSITICVLNVMDGTSGKVRMAHYPSGALPCAPSSACNNLSIAVSAIPAHLAHTCDHLGFCNGTGTQICSPTAKTDGEDESMEGAIAQDGEFGVKVYPNPFSDKFHLSVSSTSEDNLEIRIFDVLGQLIENRRGVAFATDITFGSTLSKGVYLVEVSQGEKMQTIRIVKSE